MKQLTINLPDNYYASFIQFCKDKPEIEIYETGTDEIRRLQHDMVLERVKNSKPEDYISWEEFKNNMDAKWHKK